MPTSIQLKYGRSQIAFEYDAGRFGVLGGDVQRAGLSDVEVDERLDGPIGSERIEEIVNAGGTVLIVVPDATRAVGCGQIVNLLVRRLIANGTHPSQIRIIFATGIHRRVTEEEKRTLLTPFIAQRIRTLDHDARDLARIVRLGETSGGIHVELNRALTEHDHIILIGGITWHYFAGFTGGRKLICPGLASTRTISATHKLAFDCERRTQRTGVGIGLLEGNAVNEAFMEGAAFALTDVRASASRPAFCISTIVNDSGEVIDLYCGDWKESHRAACKAFAKDHSIKIAAKRDLVIASCGGYPFDINMIQAHKTLENASRACTDGGTIILLAECAEGLGRADFLKWFEAGSSEKLAERLCENYQVNLSTAWSLMKKAERFDVRVASALDESGLKKMLLRKADFPEEISLQKNVKGYILPYGAKFMIEN